MIFSHGNAEDLGMIYDWLLAFSKDLGVNVLAYDYEGYGKATGTPTEKSCYEDIVAAYTYLTREERISPDSIVIYGRSLGSGPSLYLAQSLSEQGVKPAAVILQVPCTLSLQTILCS